MKFYQRRSVALIVLVLSILGASVYGLMKKPVDLPEVKYMNWIADEAKLLSAETENIIKTYNNNWTGKYGQTSIAVVTMESIKGWKYEDFAYVLGNEWGLGPKDMLLLVVENDHYYVALGDTLLEVMTDTQLSKLKDTIELDYYDDDGDYNDAVVSFFRQADVFYAQALSNVGSNPAFVWEDGAAAAGADTGSAIFGVIAVVIVLFAVWALLDRVRYNRYRRRVVVTPGITYYPIFWGRPRTVVRPAPPRPPQPTYHSPSSNYHPSGGTTVRRSNTTSRPSNFGNGGFGGGSRSSSSRSSGSRGSRSSGGSRGGFGRGGFGGGRR